MTERNVNRNYKDTVFRMLFEDKENLLSLYNAVNGTHYTDTENLEITTPRFVVFYNGVEPQPPRQVLRLSDAYRKKLENVELNGV